MVYFIAGGSGLVGRCLIDLFENKNIPYIASYYSRVCKKGIKVDFGNKIDIDDVLKKNNITVCINCIVQRQTDICEKNWAETKKINIDYAANLAEICASNNILLIHISTDYIFDGKNQPNDINSQPNPLQNYGISKLISELRVKSFKGRYCIIRVPVLYWEKIHNLDECALTLIGKKVLNHIELFEEDNDSIRRPVYIPDLCNFILNCIINNLEGIYHYFNPHTKLTKYEILQKISSNLNKSISHVKPSSATAFNFADRPYDTQLCDSNYDISVVPISDFDDKLKMCFTNWLHPPIKYLSNAFIMFDLDGTLVDTDKVHYESYKYALNKRGIEISWKEFEYYINNSSIDVFLKEKCLDDNIKIDKNNYFKTQNIKFVDGAEELINTLIDNKNNLVVVTNTTIEIAEYMKSKLPILNKIKNWITRENYQRPKPFDDCYSLAVQNYYKNEKYIIGFENTINGYNALKNHSKCIYFITNKENYNYNYIKKEDVFLYKDFNNADFI